MDIFRYLDIYDIRNLTSQVLITGCYNKIRHTSNHTPALWLTTIWQNLLTLLWLTWSKKPYNGKIIIKKDIVKHDLIYFLQSHHTEYWTPAQKYPFVNKFSSYQVTSTWPQCVSLWSVSYSFIITLIQFKWNLSWVSMKPSRHYQCIAKIYAIKQSQACNFLQFKGQTPVGDW